MGERRNTFTGLVGKPEWKSPLARPSHRWQNNIQINPEEVRREGVHWIYVALGRKKCYSMVTNHNMWGIL